VKRRISEPQPKAVERDGSPGADRAEEAMQRRSRPGVVGVDFRPMADGVSETIHLTDRRNRSNAAFRGFAAGHVGVRLAFEVLTLKCD
jgi:hypothetical protein